MNDEPVLLALAADVAGLEERVTQLADELAALAEAVGNLDEGGPGRPRAAAGRWGELGADEVQTAWQTLGGWTGGVLAVRHPESARALYTKAGCWARHPEVVEELWALHLAWRSAYSPRALATAPAEWLDRWLPGALRRIKGLLRRCTSQAHPDPTPDAGLLTDPEQFARAVAEDTQLRRTGEIPDERDGERRPHPA